MMLVHVSDLVVFIYFFTILDCGYLNISLFIVSHWATFFNFLLSLLVENYFLVH